MIEDLEIKSLLVLVMTGALIGLGQLLASTERLTWRIVIGRMLSSGGLALCAGSVLQMFPEIDPLALVGMAAVIASLGTSFLEKMVSKYVLK